MDWEQAIERQRELLAGIIAGLFAMAGLSEGKTIARLPFPLYRAVLRVLYPAESALRRLIVVMARCLHVKLAERRPFPSTLKILKQGGAGRMAFQLIDPRRIFNPDVRAATPKSQPRIHAFSNGQLVTILGRSPFDPLPAPVLTADAARLCRRLAAIKTAFENLPREAKRLARLRARQANTVPHKFRKPLRPGRPPGHRTASAHEVDELLKDCHWLAWEALRLDTS